MEPDDELVTCAYEAHQDNPEAWHGNTADDWQLDTDLWTCNHTVRSELIDSEDEEQFCVFHTDPADIPEEIDEAKAFVHVINEQSSSGNETDAKDKKEFVGATFGAFEIEQGANIDAGDEYPIRLSHALFQNGFSAHGVTFCHDIFAHSTEFSGDNKVAFFNANFNSDVGTIFNNAEFSGDGSVFFDEAEFCGDGGVYFAGAEFSGDGGLAFLDAEFSGNGRVTFNNAEFSCDDGVWFSGAEFSSDGGVYFDNAEFSADEGVYFDKAEFNSDSRTIFTGAKFSGDGGVSFNNAEFSGDGSVRFNDAEFSGDGGVWFGGAEFCGKVSFYNTNFSSAVQIRLESFDSPKTVSFANADFVDCDFHIDSMAEMNLERADFSGLNLSGVDFSDARLELAVFSRSVLYDSDFSGAELDGASFGNAQINESTKFVGIEPDSEERKTIFYDPEHLQRTDTPLTQIKSAIGRYPLRRPVWSHDPRSSPPAESKDTHADQVKIPMMKNQPDGSSEVKDDLVAGSKNTGEAGDEERDWELEYLQKAARTYHTIEKIGRENSLPDLQTAGFIRRQEMHRYRYAEQASTGSNGSAVYWGKWLRASAARLTLLYGESPWRVIAVALSIILSAAFLYPLGGFRHADGDVVQAESLTEYLSILPDSLYFSTLTFTTLGFGDFQPYTWGRWLATMETALGATLIALLVFVLGRRAAR